MFSKNTLRNNIRVSSSLDPGQARHFVGLDLCPNCLQGFIISDDTCRQRAKYTIFEDVMHFNICLITKKDHLTSNVDIEFPDQPLTSAQSCSGFSLSRKDNLKSIYNRVKSESLSE